jgi:hypothetical protein
MQDGYTLLLTSEIAVDFAGSSALGLFAEILAAEDPGSGLGSRGRAEEVAVALGDGPSRGLILRYVG